MPIELRSWINPQSYSNSYPTAPNTAAARPAAARHCRRKTLPLDNTAARKN
jgi:hypothetical protein